MPQVVDLLDLGQDQPQAEPSPAFQAPLKEEKKAAAREASSSEEEDPKEEKKVGGFKKLSAPPTSKLHVLENMRNLRNKLQAAQPAAVPHQQAVNNVMDMLIDLDIKSDAPPQQPAMMIAAGGVKPSAQQPESVDFFADLAQR